MEHETNSVMLDTVMQAFEEGRAAGLEEGLETGVHEGSLMAMRAVLLRLLARRGLTGTQLRQRIALETDPDQLSVWIDQTFDNRNMDHLF